MTRYIRDYILIIGARVGRVRITSPFRISFSATKSISGQLNKVNIELYNISPEVRQSIVKDAEETKLMPLSLFVGYEDRMELAFSGTIHKCSNLRSDVDIITSIECLDGGFDYLNSYTSKTVVGSDNVIDAILEDMPNTERGKITPRPALTRPRVLVGSSVNLIDDMIGEDESWYIENGTLNIIKDDEVTSSYIHKVSAKTGLILTPEREFSIVTFTMLIDPTIKIGHLIKLESTTAPYLNGIYRLQDVNYSGDNYGQDWLQTCRGMLLEDAKVL